MGEKKMIYVVKNFEKISEKRIQALYEKLPRSVKKKANARKDTPMFRPTIMEYFVVKQQLDLEDGTDFSYNKYGKPSVKDKKYFSIAHQKDILAVAVSTHEVGIDIQKKMKFTQKVAKAICSDEEYQMVVSSEDPDLELTKIWAMKDSFIKMKGTTVDHFDIKKMLSDAKDYMFNFKFEGDFVVCECIKHEVTEKKPRKNAKTTKKA